MHRFVPPEKEARNTGPGETGNRNPEKGQLATRPWTSASTSIERRDGTKLFPRVLPALPRPPLTSCPLPLTSMMTLAALGGGSDGGRDFVEVEFIYDEPF